MNLNWSNRVIKYVLFVFNLLFVISGIILIAVGVSVKSYYTDYDIFLSNRYFSLPNLLIATGSLIFFISFFGCCGAIKESWFMVFIFSLLLTLIFILEFSAGIAGYVLRDQTRDFLATELESSMKESYKPTDKPNSKTIMWDEIQFTFHCCGVHGPNDWLPFMPTSPTQVTLPPTNATISNDTSTPGSSESTPSPPSTPSTSTNETSSTETAPTGSTEPTTTPPTTTNNTSSELTADSNTTTPSSTDSSSTASLSTEPDTSPLKSLRLVAQNTSELPSSCCKSKPGTTGITECSTNTTTAYVFQEGCIDGFGDYLKDHAVTIGGVGLAIAFIQLFGIIFACHLTKQLKNGFYST